MRTRLTLAGVAWLASCAPAPSASHPMERVTIPPGASLAVVADSLESRGIVRSPGWFRLLTRLRGAERRLKAGIYDLPRDHGAWDAITALQAGRVATVRFTAPE